METGRADAGGVGEDEVALELRRGLGRDADLGELAEAGVDAVDGGLAAGGGGDDLGAGGDRRTAGGIEPRRGAGVDRGEGVERRRAGCERDHSFPPMTRR